MKYNKNKKEMESILNRFRYSMDEIMTNIKSVLQENNYVIRCNTKETEIVIESTDVDTVKKIIREKIDIPNMVLSVLVTIKASKTHTYIRQRIK